MGTVTHPQHAPGAPRPGASRGMDAFTVSPFARLARAHAAATMADAMVAASFAGAVFFSLPADDARLPVLRYLVITMLPFAVLSPLVGPLIDRMKGGHRLVVIGTILARVALCYLLIDEVEGAGPFFFLLALCLLVAQRAYQVARSALVPSVVRGDAALVEANSKLSVISGVSGFVGVLPAAALIKLGGPGWALGLAMITYGIATVLSLRIPSSKVAEHRADPVERQELRGAGILMAGSAMGLLRGCVGFLTLLIAFDFRGGDRRPWEFGVVAGASVLSQLAGAGIAPRVRAATSEENLLTGSLALVVVGAFVALLVGDVLGAAILGSCVGFAAGAGKQGFDAILQRDAPDANRGRSFARFETRFQVTWVIGALLAVAFKLSAHVGFGFVLVVSAVALGSYVIGRLALAHRTGERVTPTTAAAVEIESRIAEVSGEVKARLASAPRAAYRRVRGGLSIGDEEVDPADQAATGEVPAVGAGGEGPPVGPDGVTVDLADASTIAWHPDPAEDPSPYPWQPPVEPEPVPGAYLDDLDPAVANPFPWTPDDETVPVAERPEETEDHPTGRRGHHF